MSMYTRRDPFGRLLECHKGDGERAIRLVIERAATGERLCERTYNAQGQEVFQVFYIYRRDGHGRVVSRTVHRRQDSGATTIEVQRYQHYVEKGKLLRTACMRQDGAIYYVNSFFYREDELIGRQTIGPAGNVLQIEQYDMRQGGAMLHTRLLGDGTPSCYFYQDGRGKRLLGPCGEDYGYQITAVTPGACQIFLYEDFLTPEGLEQMLAYVHAHLPGVTRLELDCTLCDGLFYAQQNAAIAAHAGIVLSLSDSDQMADRAERLWI